MAALIASQTTDATEWKLKAGIGYDFLSQEFFLDSTTQSGADSLFIEWSLKNEYLDDLRGFATLSLYPFKDRRIELQTSYEQTSDYIRTRTINDMRLKVGSGRFDLINEFEWKQRTSDSATFGDSYIQAYSRARWTLPAGGSYSAWLQLQGDLVRFDSVAEFNYNYQRFGGKIGLAKNFENFSFADFDLFLLSRQVPDSLELNYLNFGTEFSLFAFYGTGELDLYSRWEDKDYNRDQGRDDHRRFEITVRNKLRFEDRMFVKQKLELEILKYGDDDPINYSYSRSRFIVIGGFTNGGLSVGLGPAITILDEKEREFQDGEDYLETAANIEFDYMSAGKIFLSAESSFGRRDIKTEYDLQSDFRFERLIFISDFKLMGSVNLNFLFSAEWEWHDISQENSQLYLLSSSLSYTF